MTGSDITAVVTTVGATRRGMLQKAIGSVWDQTIEPDALVVSQDNDHLGAAVTRQRGTEMVRTEFVAFLDDDDYWRPDHLQVLADTMSATGADLVYPWFDVEGGTDPFPMHEGKPWNNNAPIQFPITFLARTRAILDAGGWADVAEGAQHADGNRAGEDWRLILHLVETGAVIFHISARTWVWRHHGRNSSGLPSRIDWAVR